MNIILKKSIVLLAMLSFIVTNTAYGLHDESALRSIATAESVVPANLAEDLHKTLSSGNTITAEDVLEKMLTRADIKPGQLVEQTAGFLLDLPNESDRAYFGALYRQYKLQLLVDEKAELLYKVDPSISKEEALKKARLLVASELRKAGRNGDAIILEDAKALIIGQNFSPSALLSDKDFKDRLGAVQYEDLEKNPENIRHAAKVTMVQNPMNGGIGQAMDRLDFLKAIWHMTGRKGAPQLGAKSMDCYFRVKPVVNGQEQEAFVSVAEATILALLHEIEKEEGSYEHGILEEFISEETRQAMVDLMDTLYLYDRLDANREHKRTYGDILKEKGILGSMPEQAVFPRFSVEDGYRLTDKYTAPGNHGHWGVYTFSNIPDEQLPQDGSIQIRAIFNGDGISNAPNNVIAGWMARENVPVVMITTTRAPIDVKGGMLGIEDLEGGKYRTNILEVADAKTNDKKHPGQTELFARMGISSADSKFGREGMQLFNTNTVLQNDTALQPFLKDLRELLGAEEYNRVISPKMMMKSAVQKDGKEYVQLEGPLGSSVLSLAGFLSTTNDPAIKALCKKHNIDPKEFLRIVNIDVDKRTDFFAPIKFPIDYWIQFFSDHFKVDTTTWKLINLRPGHVPALDTPDQDKDKYYSNVLNLFKLFGDNGIINKGNPVMTSTIGLDYMKIRGKVKVAGSILRGIFVAINESDDVVDLTAGAVRDRLISENIAIASEDGRLILENALVVISADGRNYKLVKLQPGASAGEIELEINRAKMLLFGVLPILVDELINRLKSSQLKLYNEELDVYDKSDKKLGTIDRKLAHETGLFHHTANAFVLTPDGKILLQRRPIFTHDPKLNKTEPGRLSIYGGHATKGQDYLKAIEEELKDELNLKSLSGHLIPIGQETYADPKGKNNEHRALYAYVLTKGEYEQVEAVTEEIEKDKHKKSREEFEISIKKAQDAKLGKGEVYGQIFVNSIDIFDAQENAIGRYIEITEPFKDSVGPEQVNFTSDLLERLASDSEIKLKLGKEIADLNKLAQPKTGLAGIRLNNLLDDELKGMLEDLRGRLTHLRDELANIPSFKPGQGTWGYSPFGDPYERKMYDDQVKETETFIETVEKDIKDIEAILKARYEGLSKSSSAGINLTHLSDYDAEHYLASFLLDYSPTGIIEVANEAQAIVVYSDSLKESPALQDIIRNSAGDSRRFYLVNKEEHTSTDAFLAGLNIDKDIFERHVFLQNSLTAEQLALQIAGFLYSNKIKQGRIFASTEEDLFAWSKQGLIEALVMLLKDKRFEIISDYSQQHMEYIRTYEQILIAA